MTLTNSAAGRPWAPDCTKINYIYKSLYAYAHAADPEYSLRQSSLRQPSFEALFSRPYLIEIPGRGGDPGEPRGPKGTQGEARGGQGDPKEPKGNQGEGTQGYPRGPRGPKGAFGALGTEWAHGAIWGYSEAISNGKQFRVGGYYEWEDILRKKEAKLYKSIWRPWDGMCPWGNLGLF